MNSTLLKVIAFSSVFAVSACDNKPEEQERQEPPQPEASTSIMNESAQAPERIMNEEAQGPEHNAQGTVSAVDRENNQVVVALDPVPELNWPADTKSFRVEDRESLDKLEQGDRVEFSFKEIAGGQYMAQDMSEQ